MAHGDEIYNQLNTSTLSDVSAPNINLVTAPIHIQKTNEDALRTTVLLNKATMRDGGVIPNTMKIDVVTESDTGYYDVFIPQAGECMMVCTLNWETKNAGSISWYVNDGTNRARISYMSSTAPDLGAELPPNLYIAQPCKLEVYVESSSGSNTMTCTRLRVR